MSQSTQSQPTTTIATFSRVISFHSTHMMVYQYQGRDYVPAKPIADIIGIDWRNVKKSIGDGDNQKLYGATRFLLPKIDNLGGDITPQNETLVDVLCLRLDRVQMFLARVNTARLRSHGNIDNADYLLTLQQEWADALHDYETHGIAIKNTVFTNTKQLKTLVDIYSKLNDKQQKHVISKQIDACLGIEHRYSDQPDMFDKNT